jgi:hypothetical protein
MTELATAWMLGCACGFFMSVTIARPPRDRDPDWRRSFNHENTNRPSGPPPLKLRRDTRSIWFPDPDPSRRATNPYTGEPVQPNPPPRNP